MRFSGQRKSSPWIEVVGVVKAVRDDLKLSVHAGFLSATRAGTWGSDGPCLLRTTVDPLALGSFDSSARVVHDKDQRFMTCGR